MDQNAILKKKQQLHSNIDHSRLKDKSSYFQYKDKHSLPENGNLWEFNNGEKPQFLKQTNSILGNNDEESVISNKNKFIMENNRSGDFYISKVGADTTSHGEKTTVITDDIEGVLKEVETIYNNKEYTVQEYQNMLNNQMNEDDNLKKMLNKSPSSDKFNKVKFFSF